MMLRTPWAVASWPERAWLELLRLQHRDNGTGDVVVCRDGAVDLVTRPQQHLREDGAALVASQSGTNCCGPFVILPDLNNGFRTSFPLEPGRVRIRRPAPQLGDDGIRLPLEGDEDAPGLIAANLVPVERDEDLPDTADDLTVVVDRRATGPRKLLQIAIDVPWAMSVMISTLAARQHASA